MSNEDEQIWAAGNPMGINSFAEAENWYNNTTPVNEHGMGTKRDIRPLYDRRKKWERIVKADKDTYVLLCGEYGDDFWNRKDDTITKEQVKLAPIVWRRTKEHGDTITIRNGPFYTANYGRFRFINQMLPWGKLGFYCRNGKQYITHASNRTRYLKKSRVCTKQAWDIHKAKKAGVYSLAPWWWKGTIQNMTPRDDGSALTYKVRGDGSFAHLSGGLPEEFIRTRVNIPAKKKHAAGIKDFWDWMLITSPLIGETSWQDQIDALNQLRGDRDGNDYVEEAEQTLAIMADVEHPHRVNLAKTFLPSVTARNFHYGKGIREVILLSTTSDARNIEAARHKYNKWVNKTCGFEYTVMETKGERA